MGQFHQKGPEAGRPPFLRRTRGNNWQPGTSWWSRRTYCSPVCSGLICSREMGLRVITTIPLVFPICSPKLRSHSGFLSFSLHPILLLWPWSISFQNISRIQSSSVSLTIYALGQVQTTVTSLRPLLNFFFSPLLGPWHSILCAAAKMILKHKSYDITSSMTLFPSPYS